MPVQVVDLFCGVGGLTRGLLDAGLDVVAGFDIDATCQFTYEHRMMGRCSKVSLKPPMGTAIMDRAKYRATMAAFSASRRAEKRVRLLVDII